MTPADVLAACLAGGLLLRHILGRAPQPSPLARQVARAVHAPLSRGEQAALDAAFERSARESDPYLH